jgi:hypothetical protein
MEISWFDIVLLLGFAVGFVICYIGPVAWAIRDANERGFAGGIIVLLFLMGGPLAAVIWFIIRPLRTLSQINAGEYDNADDAMAAAAKLDQIGEWDSAERLYLLCIDRWPEHAAYAKRCLDAIREKRKLH